MFAFSGSEFVLIVVVAILAVGPKQLPEVLHGLGKLYRRMQYMRYSLTRQFDDFMDHAELNDLRNPTRLPTSLIEPDLFDEAKEDEEHHMMPLSPHPTSPLERGEVKEGGSTEK